MPVQELAAALIRVFEGLRLTAYSDSGGVWTLGFGHTSGVEPGDSCTLEQAAAWLAADAQNLFRLAADKPLYAQAAYVSFGYNCGKHALELVLAGSAQMGNFIHDRHGNALEGLRARRALEMALIASSNT